MGAHRSDVELLALHAVRLRGMATPAAAAARFGLDRDVVGELLEDFAAFGWVRYDEFAGTGGCFELHETCSRRWDWTAALSGPAADLEAASGAWRTAASGTPRPTRWLTTEHSPQGEDDALMILPKVRDPRLVTVRRGGTLSEEDHRLLALWSATCAEHVLAFFESARPQDPRPRRAIDQVRAWTRGEVPMMETRAAGGHAMAAARELHGAPRHAAYAAGQAAVVAHVAEHDLGAAAYAIRAAVAAAPPAEAGAARLRERRWQRDQLPEAVRELVLDDQRRRNHLCWSVFDP